MRGETRVLWQVRPCFTGAGRARLAYVGSADAPFYYLSALGGGMMGRGSIEDRFPDQGV